MTLREKFEKLRNIEENMADTDDLISALDEIHNEKIYLYYSESKKTQLLELLEEGVEDYNDLESSKDLIDDLYRNRDLFESREEMGLNSSNYPNINGIIYTLIGEIGETQYVMSISDELYYLQEDDAMLDLSYEEMKERRCRSLHTNDMGKEMTEIKRLS